MSRYVYDFVEGNKDLKDLLGGKGANLAEMTRMGLPVPPGFTITTDACREYLHTGSVPAGLFAELEHHLRLVQTKLVGDGLDELLVLCGELPEQQLCDVVRRDEEQPEDDQADEPHDKQPGEHTANEKTNHWFTPRGSSASRTLSPRRLNARVVRISASPGKSRNHHATW